MDHHCPWINSCVGARNTKYFFLFTLYTGIGALLSIAILITCFILLLREENENHTKQKMYAVAFFVCVCVFIESILFSFFTLELVGEQLESFQDNQTYVDDLKDLFGEPLTLIDSLLVWIGEDWWFWTLPTRPVMQINY
jgi:cytochrome bd-type quinol oxidase subunit 2